MRLATLFSIMSLLQFACGAHAATISLVPTSSTTIAAGGAATFDLYVDASDVGGILAGGLDLFYDNGILSYNGDFAFDAGFATDPFLSRTGDDCASSPSTSGCGSSGEINGIGFGDFSGLAASGSTLVGSLSFTGKAPGTSLLTMADNEYPAGPWSDTSANLIAMNYTGLSATVIPVVLPVPAAVWLFGSGLLGLIGIARRKAA